MREHVFAVIAHQTSQPTTYEAFATSCQQWLRDGREGIFWREMLHFINRRVDMGVWDQSRCYYSVDGTLYDPAHRQRTESDEEVQVVNVVLRDPRRRRNVGNVELIVVSDDEISVSTNGGRTIDSTRATNGTGDSDREMNGLSSETDTDATEFRDHWDREIETSDDHMDVSEDSRARAQSSRRRDTPDPRSPSLDRNIQREIQRQQPMVVHSINSIHMRRQQRRGPESRQLHRQETSRPVRSSASSRSAAERRRSVRQGRSTTTTSRSSRVMRHGLRGTTRSTRPRDDEDMDTEGEGDPLPVPIPSRYPRNRILQRTARGDSPDPRHRSFAPRPRASGSMERRPMSGRLRSGGSRRNRY
ncbi:uncharacterized protein LOC129602031 [Paramacrobiotus metropolitanus]|uniref:uncharacterized protein LOC129602031 n=1 Tax=Paramacrobiotus metropolitanus TaxID=2943436 RepID=UPI002445F0CB|nr:uncharacterized protein LOC129602031 [Paramacrobiotus metropolitanus]